jgi:hypothetical protein
MRAPVSETPYRVPEKRPPDPYLVEWMKLRRMRRLAIGWLVLWALAFVAGALSSQGRTTGLLIIGAILVGAVVFQWWIYRFRCPHCRRTMFRMQTDEGSDFSRCTQCGILVGTPQSEAGARPSATAVRPS